jgi:hypothetical protein
LPVGSILDAVGNPLGVENLSEEWIKQLFNDYLAEEASRA